MKFRMFVPMKAVGPLELEQPSTSLRIHLTRLLRKHIDAAEGDESGVVALARMNRFINRARTLMELPIYVLEADDWGQYEFVEHAWHYGEFELIFRRLNTVQFAEFLGELIQQRFISVATVNKLLALDGLAFTFSEENGLHVEVLSLSEVEDLAKTEPQWHENIRLLLARMEAAHAAKDFAAVIHAGASVFETLAKEVVGLPQVQNQTLGGFFGRYRNDSGLPPAILDHVEALYNRRNSTPLAGHGSLSAPPQLTEPESRTLVEMTKAFVTIEYKLKLAGATFTAPRHVPAAPGAAGAAAAPPAVPSASIAPGVASTPPPPVAAAAAAPVSTAASASSAAVKK